MAETQLQPTKLGSYIQPYECVIVGTGFVGTTIANTLDEYGVNYLLLEPSLAESSLFNFGYVSDNVDLDLIQKTIRIGGGIQVWGGGLTNPTAEHFFDNNSEQDWNNLGSLNRSTGGQTLATELASGRFIFTKSESRRIKRIFGLAESSLVPEKHRYLGGTFGSPEKYRFLQPHNIENLMTADLVDITLDSPDGFHRVSVRGADGRIDDIYCRRLIFAAGTIGNAYLTFLATGNNSFQIGNHLSAIVGTVYFRDPRRITSFLQTWNPDETSFITLSLPLSIRRSLELGHSGIRFHPIPPPPLKSEIQRTFISFVRSFFSPKSLKPLIWRLTDLIYFIVSRKRLNYGMQIHILADVSLNKSNSLEFDYTTNPTLASLEITLDEDCLKELTELMQRLILGLSSGTNIFKFDVPCYFDGEVSTQLLTKYDWLDSAHYFGSLPMGGNIPNQSVNIDFTIDGQKNVRAIGASSFPIGNHGHPTLLTILLAKTFSRNLSQELLETK
jgi:hypothetical protein